MRTIHAVLAAAALGLAGLMSVPASPQQAKAPAIDPAKVEAAIKSSWTKAAPDWLGRLAQDETQRECSEHRNAPPKAIADAIQKREAATIQYPADGKLMGDWKNGEKLAQNGYGGRFTDYPPRQENGGNCYACHQLDKKEVSYGTVGPTLLEYGKIRKFAEADVKAVYDKVYNAHAAFPCSQMPRFGTAKFLTIEQIKDLVALVMSPDSPVNK
jgi:sulfur-oxidizing protein SoxX